MKMGIFVAANCFAGWDVNVNIESYEGVNRVGVVSQES